MTSAAHRGAGTYRFLRITADGTLVSTGSRTPPTLTLPDATGQQPGIDRERTTNAVSGTVNFRTPIRSP